MKVLGAYGFRKGIYDKITYNIENSEPKILGRKILKFICENETKDMEKMAERKILVDRLEYPTPLQAAECKRYRRYKVSSNTNQQWSDILKDTTGDLGLLKSKFKYMTDASILLRNSILCDYAYIINLNNRALEFYIGDQLHPSCNRYKCCDGDIQELYVEANDLMHTYNCKLYNVMYFHTIRNNDIEGLVREMESSSRRHIKELAYDFSLIDKFR